MEIKSMQNHYNLFASLLSYPNKESLSNVESTQEYLNKNYPDAAKTLNEFTGFARTIPIWKWEEIYMRTFDVQAITTLDIGYVLFGDDYKRGELLVNLSKEHSKVGNDCETELSDHLPNLLRLLSKINNQDFKDDLIYLIIKPGLKKIIGEFDRGNIEKKSRIYEKHHRTLIPFENNYGTVYKSLLQALLLVLNTDFTDDQTVIAEDISLKTNFANELEIPD
jgi:nitrate reductase assembly molybdenum cofactor insertion protein NarJ